MSDGDFAPTETASTDTSALANEAEAFRGTFSKVRDEVARVMVGQADVIDGVLVALFCGGNVLLEGVPGLGKTELVKALSRVLDLEFRRVQFTPDLMPADIIGTTVMAADDHGRYQLEFKPGPIFTQLLLADEINRASPKTQSALLETMQEGSVTTGGTVHILEQPFFVMATQNPLEQEGTYPLPEAQLDRFLFKVNVPFPNRHELNDIVTRTILKEPINLDKILDGHKIVELRKTLDKMVVTESVRDFAVRLVMSTHPDTPDAADEVKQYVRWGASPRAAQGLIKAARVRALADGRVHVAVDDIRHFAVPVLQHRVLLNYDGQAEEVSVAKLVQDASKALSAEPTYAV
ncbi:AAA family ATPase [Stratiformator vulcanicus]|uniref:ATPase family associated with various cellular activities (AAA) n=1 Tax=Stratiformator vulcanicus TaxID=2527980 RepID=A0A517R0I4_9PLAN|nr:MoxR family ATPase [Stratiformator vulcanicus]QDT37343.1 ATPase family associated with various cellular activities (AAA) [Stratiformator vulcanicus]